MPIPQISVQHGCKYFIHERDIEVSSFIDLTQSFTRFQKAMSVKVGQNVDPKFVNRLLATNFQIMDDMGERTMMPFLQDVVRVDGLVGSLARSFVADPAFMPQIVAHVGLPSLVDWLGHLGAMCLYTVLHGSVTPLIRPMVDRMNDPRQRFQWRRRMEAWKFGSGCDYLQPNEN